MRREIRDSCRTTRWWFRPTGEKDVERDTILVLDFEKFNADSVFLHPLDRSETHFHGGFIPRKIQRERELLAALKEVIDTESGTLTRNIKQGSVVGVLGHYPPDRGFPCDGDALGKATIAHWA
jgi:hypothetical protein